jgi:hypothetical protein
MGSKHKEFQKSNKVKKGQYNNVAADGVTYRLRKKKEFMKEISEKDMNIFSVHTKKIRVFTYGFSILDV